MLGVGAALVLARIRTSGVVHLTLVGSAIAVLAIAGTALLRIIARPANVPPVPFSDDAVATLERAGLAAQTRGNNLVTPEHILLELLENTASVRALQSLGIDVQLIRRELQTMLPVSIPKREQVTPIYTAHAKVVLEHGVREAFAMRCTETEPLHLLAGLMRGRKTPASRVLTRAGVTLEGIRASQKMFPQT